MGSLPVMPEPDGPVDLPAAPDAAPRSGLRQAVASRLEAAWRNPLLVDARFRHPLSPLVTGRLLPIAAGVLAIAAGVAWLTAETRPGRLAGTALTGVSLAFVLGLLLAVAPLAAIAARGLLDDLHGGAWRFSTDALETAQGLLLTALWRVRWPALLALALTPALVVGMLRLEISSYVAWRGATSALGGAASERAAALLVDGRIPAVRVALRALGAGLLPWAALPLFAALGVLAAVWLDDPALAPLAALAASVIGAAAVIAVWAVLTRTPLLAGEWEAARALLLVGLAAGLLWGAGRISRRVAGELDDELTP